MEKQIFKAGDRVFDIRYGWGEVRSITTDIYPIEIFFKKYGFKTYTSSGSTEIGGFVSLSFTEYTLKGFSQERPIDYNDYIGKWGKFTSEYGVFIDKLESFGSYGKNSDKYFFRAKGANKELYEFIPLTEEQIKILKLQDDNKK